MKLYDDIRSEIENFAKIPGNGATINECDGYIRIYMSGDNHRAWGMRTLYENEPGWNSGCIKRIREFIRCYPGCHRMEPVQQLEADGESEARRECGSWCDEKFTENKEQQRCSTK